MINFPDGAGRQSETRSKTESTSCQVMDSALVPWPFLLTGRFTRAESVEHLLHLGPRFPRARRKSRHDWQEAVAGQSLKFKVGGRPDRGGTPRPAQQRDLAEAFPRPERGDQPTVTHD